ncbi:MAG: hypothetical protein CL582_14960, partial [Alteromonadaceae bacterium]|nr:hypothetical protein [Alteromonadaceae bacterium]
NRQGKFFQGYVLWFHYSVLQYGKLLVHTYRTKILQFINKSKILNFRISIVSIYTSSAHADF